MPGGGRTQERDYSPNETRALAAGSGPLCVTPGRMMELLGEKTRNVHLNADAFWANVPERVWAYKLGGYQVWTGYHSYAEPGTGERMVGEVVSLLEELKR